MEIIDEKREWLKDTAYLTFEIVGTLIASTIHLVLDISSKKSDSPNYQKKY
jgi:hypothetical protein